MFGWFVKGRSSISVEVDMHSHLIPGIDDGCKSLEESVTIISKFQELGYKKLITTPHIYPEFYPNTKKIILENLGLLRKAIQEAGLTIQLEAAAEYFIDTELLTLIETPNEILSFGGEKYVLIETSFINRPLIFDEVVFRLKAQGFTPILAHPERYTYLLNDFSWLKKIKAQGVQLQMTASSLVGAYGRGAQKIANRLLKENLVDFIASDIHRSRQLIQLQKALKQKIIPQNLKNNELI